jgi:molecular chaperone HtpG
MWCLEDDFVVSLNEYISSVLDNRDRAELGLIALEFHRDDFINWWFEPGEQTR